MRPGKAGRLDWRQVGILYRREMRAALREKTILINSVLIPLFLYPFILWAMFTGLMFVQGQTEDFSSRVLVRAWPESHRKLRLSFERDEHLALVDPKKAARNAPQQLQRGQLDALLEFVPAREAGTALSSNFQARITYNQSKERSATARDRTSRLIQQYRDDWFKREALARGATPADWERFQVATRNVASRKQMGGFLLGLMLPLLFVVMVAVGCFYPAVDALAGERERKTWETLMSTAATRLSIVTAKYLYVASLGMFAGLLNILAMLLTIKPIMAPLVGKAGMALDFTAPMAAFPLILLAGVLLAGFVAAGMMVFAVFARTFKEGQAMITPFYLVILLPLMFMQTPGLKLTPLLACVPMANLSLMLRGVLAGSFPWLSIGITVVVSAALIAACLWLAAFILQFEDVMLGSYNGSLARFLRQHVFKRTG
jgi:sodium transport system permease protein